MQLHPEASNFCKYRVQHTIGLIHDDREAHFSELAQNWQPEILEFCLALPFILCISSPKTDKPLAFIFPQAEVQLLQFYKFLEGLLKEI